MTKISKFESQNDIVKLIFRKLIMSKITKKVKTLLSMPIWWSDKMRRKAFG